MPAYKDDERGTWYCEFRYKEINGFSRKKKKPMKIYQKIWIKI